jgi:outer membrane protein assembly factor BamA
MINDVLLVGDTAGIAQPFSADEFRGLRADEDGIQLISQILVSHYGERGYPFVQVCIDDLRLLADSSLDIAFRVTSGPVSRFDTLIVQGTGRRTATYLTRISGIDSGDLFRDSEIESAKLRLRSHRFIEVDDSVELIFRDDFSKCTPVFKARQLPTNLVEGSLGYQPAYGDQSAYVKGSARLEFENLFARGRRIGLRYNKRDPLSHEVALEYYQPYLFYQPLSVSANIEQLKYDSLYQKLSVDSKIEYGEGSRVSVRVTGGWSRYTPNGSLFLGVFHSRRYWWGAGSTINLTSSDIHQRFDLDIAYGIKQQYSFAAVRPEDTRISDTRLSGEYNSATPILGPVYQRSRVSSAAIVTDEATIPLSDLYELGGARTLRGYRDDQFLCERFVSVSVEPGIQLAKGAEFHIFSDGAWFRQSTGETLVRFGSGAGLEFGLPTGRLRMDVAWGKDDSFSDGKLYVILESRF